MDDTEYLQELLSLGQSNLGQRMKLELQTIGGEIVAKLDTYNQAHWLDDTQQKERAIYVAKLQQTLGIIDILFNEETIKALLETSVEKKKALQDNPIEDPEEIRDLDKELVY